MSSTQVTQISHSTVGSSFSVSFSANSNPSDLEMLRMMRDWFIRWNNSGVSFTKADTPQTKSCFYCNNYEPKGWCNLFEDTVSPNNKCCGEFTEIKPYECEIKALHKSYQEPYCEIADTPQTEKTCDNCGTPRDKCVYCIEEDRMWTPQTETPTAQEYEKWLFKEPQTDCD